MADFAELFSQGEIRNYKKKELVLSPKNPPKGIYRITDGYIYSYSLTSKKKKKIQLVFKPGEIFPLATTIIRMPFRFYFETLEKTIISRLPTEEFFTKVYADKTLSKELSKAFSNYLALYVERTENLEYETVRKRVVGRLLFFAHRFGEKKDSSIFIHIPITHDFIAQSINVARENVSRELAKLEEEKLIAFQGKNLVIFQDGKLTKLLNN